MTDSSDSPFQRLSREVLVDNPWHRYCRDRYTLRGGGAGEYYYVDMPGSCATIPIFDDGSTVLVHSDRYLLGKMLWEFPIGGMKTGEDPQEVAAKELAEEAGLAAERWDLVGRFAPYKGVSNEVCWFFRATELTWTEQELETCEDMTVHRMPFAEAREHLLSQELGDGQSLAGLMLYERWVENRAT